MLAALCFLAAGRRDSLAAAADPASAPALNERDLLLDVIVNGNAIGMLGDFHEKRGEIYATRKELDSLGFRVPGIGHAVSADELIPIAKLSGATYRVEESTQSIYITVLSSGLKPTELGPPASLASTLPVTSGTGAVVNYDLGLTEAEHRLVGEMVFDGRIFTPWAVTESSFTATNEPGIESAPVVRLDTTVTASAPATMRQYQLGDLTSSSLDWSRSVRLGGFQISTNFGIRPDLVTFPVPTIAGEVAVPSSVDVLINGVQELSQPVPPGPFELRELPVVTGVGDVSVLVRNEAGQQTTQTLQFYGSRELVKPGLEDFSAELGLVRLNYGTESNDYRAPAGSATFRRGLTNWLTLEAHAEGSDGGGSYEGVKILPGGMAGGGAVVALGGFGLVSGDIAGSRFGRRSGGLASAGFERIAPHVSVSVSVQATSGGFADIAADYSDPVPRLQARAIVGLSWSDTGSFGFAFTEQRSPAALAQSAQTTVLDAQAAERDQFGFVPLALATRTSLLSISYSHSLFRQRAFLSATAFHDFSNRNSSGATVGLTMPLGRRSAVGVEGDAGTGGVDGVVQASQAAVDIGDVGYQLREEDGALSRQFALGSYRAAWGIIDAGIDRNGANTAFRGDLQGAVAYAGGGVFPSLPINDSFAVVDTEGVSGVHVLQENRPIGSTNASGQLLVTDLRSFDANRLAIDPSDIPMDADAGPETQLVRPRDRSGVVVHFKIKPSQGAVVVLHDESGKAVQLGSNARLEGRTDTQDLVVGYDGEVFATGLLPHNRLLVLRPDGTRCVADFDYAPVAGQIPRIGPRLCHTVPP